MFSISQVREKAEVLESMLFCTKGIKVSVRVYKRMGDIIGHYGLEDIDDFTKMVEKLTKESYFNFTSGFILFTFENEPIYILSFLDFMSINNLYLNEGFSSFQSAG